MHELSVIKSILDIVVEHAEKHGIRKVRAIQLEVGMLSDLSDRPKSYGIHRVGLLIIDSPLTTYFAARSNHSEM